MNSAIDQSNIEAMYDLGKIYEAGVYLEKNYSLAAKYLLMAAEGEHVKAMHDIGVMYFNGTGIPKDAAAANKWYLSAANRGSYLSSYCLGLNEESGENSQRRASVALAIVWYLIAHAQCDGEANEPLHRVAQLKRNLSTSDVEKVIHYLTAFADDRQFPWAQLALGDMYLNGEFVQADTEAARRYFSLAAEGGVEAAKKRLASPKMTGDDLFYLRRIVATPKRSICPPICLNQVSAQLKTYGKQENFIFLPLSLVFQIHKQRLEVFMFLEMV